MYPEAYKEWIGIFNDDLLEIWQKERTELQKAAMLLTALQKELKDVQTNVEVELINLQQRLKYKDDLEVKTKSLSPRNKKKSPNSINKENINPCTRKDESPDLFKNIDPNVNRAPPNTSIIDLSLSDEDKAVEGSPTIKRRRRHYHRRKIASPSFNNSVNIKPNKSENTPINKVAERTVKANLFKTPLFKSDDDVSVIENTPEVTSERSSTVGKVSGLLSKKTGMTRWIPNNTLTQMFGKPKKKLEMNATKKGEEDVDSDETYCEEDTGGSKMGITDMLSYINKDETVLKEKKSAVDRANNDSTASELEADSSQEVDQFSKGAIFNEADVATPNENPEPIPLEPEPVVRGKARQQLQGWTCERCKDFYGQMNLSPEELKKKMDECSRHRYKYRPPEETIEGYWNLSIPAEKPD